MTLGIGDGMALGIGDGTNVSMMQMSDVGVEISEQEWMQAVIASDFVMHFIQKLLLIHGHWCFSQLSQLVLYFFYKNVVSSGSEVMVKNWFTTEAFPVSRILVDWILKLDGQ